ncbi:hypothetical protein [Kitasatospora sp. NBC_01539]|uniref:hypothetical protein n=1 Tax=Kitasatospora sp. NBC_01539 TaxID=2903577 RepID=UPI0038601554
MSFRVNVGDVRGYGTLVGRSAENAAACKDHLGSEATVDKGLASELWEMCSVEHEKFVDSGTQILEKIRAVMVAGSRELGNVAANYSGTETGEAARLDATYARPGGPAPSGGTGSGPSFADRRDAVAELAKKDGGDGYLAGHVAEFEFTPVNKVVGTVLDLGSPSALINEACKLFLGFDPYGELLKAIMGDWESYAACGTTWSRIGKACGAMADNVQGGNDTLATTWDGNAADAAWAYFERFQGKLREVGQGFAELDAHYFEIAQFVFSLAEFLKAGLAFMVDRLLVALALQVAATAAASTVVGAAGAAIGYAAAVAQVVIAIDKWAEMTAQLAQVSLALTGVLTAKSVIIGTVTGVMQDFPEVGGAYDHPAATV